MLDIVGQPKLELPVLPEDLRLLAYLAITSTNGNKRQAIQRDDPRLTNGAMLRLLEAGVVMGSSNGEDHWAPIGPFRIAAIFHHQEELSDTDLAVALGLDAAPELITQNAEQTPKVPRPAITEEAIRIAIAGPIPQAVQERLEGKTEKVQRWFWAALVAASPETGIIDTRASGLSMTALLGLERVDLVWQSGDVNNPDYVIVEEHRDLIPDLASLVAARKSAEKAVEATASSDRPHKLHKITGIPEQLPALSEVLRPLAYHALTNVGPGDGANVKRIQSGLSCEEMEMLETAGVLRFLKTSKSWYPTGLFRIAAIAYKRSLGTAETLAKALGLGFVPKPLPQASRSNAQAIRRASNPSVSSSKQHPRDNLEPPEIPTELHEIVFAVLTTAGMPNVNVRRRAANLNDDQLRELESFGVIRYYDVKHRWILNPPWSKLARLFARGALTAGKLRQLLGLGEEVEAPVPTTAPEPTKTLITPAQLPVTEPAIIIPARSDGEPHTPTITLGHNGSADPISVEVANGLLATVVDKIQGIMIEGSEIIIEVSDKCTIRIGTG